VSASNRIAGERRSRELRERREGSPDPVDRVLFYAPQGADGPVHLIGAVERDGSRTAVVTFVTDRGEADDARRRLEDGEV
jgi:hypothetical protein